MTKSWIATVFFVVFLFYFSPTNVSAHISSQKVEEIESLYGDGAVCDICKTFVSAVGMLVRGNASQSVIEGAVEKLCVNFKIELPDVCQGIVQEFGPEILVIFSEKILDPLSVCTTIHLCSSTKPQFTGRSLENLLQHAPATEQNKVVRSRAQDVGYFIQISDVHFDANYSIGSTTQCGRPLCCRAEYGLGTNENNTAGRFGDYNCDVPRETVEAVFQQISSMPEVFDFILWTGDDPPHDVWRQSREWNLGAAQSISDMIRQYLPKVPVFPAVGNHESFPVNQFEGTDADNWLYEGLLKAWSGWLEPAAEATFRLGGYYTQLVRPGLRIVALNTQHGITGNFWLFLNRTRDPTFQLAWLQDTLHAARANQERVFVVGHVANGDPGNWYEFYADELHRITDAYSDVILSYFYGHTHADHFEIVRDVASNSKPTGIAFICPSVTSYTDTNPSFRVYSYDRATGEVVDYTQYRADLTVANQQGKIVFEPAYTATQLFNVSSLNAVDMQQVALRMFTDDALFNTYYADFHTGVPSATCDAGCRRNFVCALNSFTEALYKQCMSSHFDPKYISKANKKC